MMQVNVIPIDELSPDMCGRWLEMQAVNPNLRGPCFHPELFKAVGKFCPHVQVALLSDNKGLQGFLPFRKEQESPVARTINFCDYQAVVGLPSQLWDMGSILKAAGLEAWHFSALADFENITSKVENRQAHASPRIDLKDGLEGYLSFLAGKGVGFKRSSAEKRIQQKWGALRFVPVCRDIEVLRRLLEWKNLRYHCSAEWMRLASGLLEHIYYLNDLAFSGVLSALYAGDELLAAHFALRYQGILHGLVMAFNPDLSAYAPGLLILPYVISEYRTLQYDTFDFGSGEEQYKWDFSNTSLPVVRGNFQASSFRANMKSINQVYQNLWTLLSRIKPKQPLKAEI
jgi:CelD/BcsL family acetyltransferase involved in cellulose biosynthesis